MGEGGFFFVFGSTSIRSTVVTRQTEGLKVGCVGKNKVFIKPLALALSLHLRGVRWLQLSL